MTTEEIRKVCKTCDKRKIDLYTGLVCSLTGEIGKFETSCKDYSKDPRIILDERDELIEKEKADIGREKTINVFIGIIALSLFFIVYSHFSFKPLNAKEIVKESIRIILQCGLFYAIFTGKNWAKGTYTVLAVLAALLSIFLIATVLKFSTTGLVLLIMTGGYLYGIYFFNFDKDFNSFFEYQKKLR
jgi:hypothetical protein